VNEKAEIPLKRGAIAACLMLGVFMQALDTTIANVALPYMQGSVSASQDEIAWVLTSYIVAAAIMTPATGFLAGRFGVKRLFLLSIGGFTLASILCGAAQSLDQIVLFRVLQGMCGAALSPLAQSVMFNIMPRNRQGGGMAVFGIAVMVGPVLGPVIGGALTEYLNWRYVFYVNVPFGIVAFIGSLIFLPEFAKDTTRKLDWFGFAMLSIAIGALQILLDRGEEKDWFGNYYRDARLLPGLLFVPGSDIHGAPAIFEAGSVREPELRSRSDLRLRRRTNLFRFHGVAAALSAGTDELSRPRHRSRHGSARHRHHGLDADCWPAGGAD
jgi:MFS family permease